ncbi:MAG TPA: hypothetical protein VEH77_18280 [Roseiarcus sp.]|nr:hypothetical protein [Roseiarcus sp.]
MGRPRALDRSTKARIMRRARCLSRGGSGYRDGNLAALPADLDQAPRTKNPAA